MEQAQQQLRVIWNLICENEEDFIEVCFANYGSKPTHILDISLGMVGIVCKCDWGYGLDYDQVPLRAVLKWVDKIKENK